MLMVMPRCFSSGALSIWSKAVKVVVPEVSRSARTLVMAAVSVVLPWSMWPMVPMLRWGLSRTNCFLAISPVLLSLCRLGTQPLLASNPGHDLTGDRLGDLLIGMELHRVRRATLGARP